MYLEHFGLKELPFSIAPNPRYLYLTRQHQEALAHLAYGLGSEGGIILLTGEVGTGKTTISRKLLEQIPEHIDVAWIINPRLSVEELLASICDELSISYPDDHHSIKVFTDLISAHLIEKHSHGRNVVLMIDEAQNLSAEVLEQLRLLTNLETNERKLLQIVLLGQPELKAMLERNDLRQLAQRITARYHLNPLNRVDACEYIRHRLATGGCSRPVFSQKAMTRIHAHSGGTPRLINLICDRAMLGVYGQNGAIVEPSHVNQASREILGEEPAVQRQFFTPATASITLMLFLVAAGGWWILGEEKIRLAAFQTTEVSTIHESVAEQAPAQVVAQPEAGIEEASLPAMDASATNHVQTSVTLDEPMATASVASETPLPTAEQTQADEPWASIEKAGRRKAALLTLADIWNISVETSTPVCEQISKHDLTCLKQRRNVWALKEMNRPALVTLAGNSGKLSHAVIRSISNDQATLQVDQKQWTVTLSELEQRWQGKLTIIWSRPPGYVRTLRQGDHGQTVSWLSRQLDRIQGSRMIPPRVAESMDALLIARLKEFQKQHGLKADGMAGIITLMRINELIHSDSPMLSGRGNS